MPRKTRQEVKNLEKFTLSILITPYGDGYIAMCKETGLIRHGSTLVEARDSIISSTKTLLEAISEDHSLTPSLTVGLPIKYRFIFEAKIIWMHIRGIMKNVYLVQPASQFNFATV